VARQAGADAADRGAGAASRTPTRRRAHQVLLGGGHLAVLWAIAVAQPLFDLLGRNPEFFAVRGSTPREIVLFAVALTLVPPAVLTAVEALAELVSTRLRAGLHVAFVAVLFALIALQAGKSALEEPGVALVIAAVLAVSRARSRTSSWGRSASRRLSSCPSRSSSCSSSCLRRPSRSS
jgi:hypothetical protein